MDPDISPLAPLGPRERRRRRRGQGRVREHGRGRSAELDDTQEIPVAGGVAGTGTGGGTGGGAGVYGLGLSGGTPRNRAAGGRAHRVGAYGNRAYRAGRRAAAARAYAAAADATADAAAAAYDALYQRSAADVTRHTYLLTGDHALTREAVEHAFHLAWERWPEVASDRDPPGWVRAAAFAYAQAPWEWLRARRRRRLATGRRRRAKEPYEDEAYGEAADRRLFAALRALPESYRSAVVVYDVVGLDLPEAAAELEASTLAAAGRLTHAHEALADAVPELRDLPPRERAEALRARLRRFAAAQPIRTLPPGAARHRSERRTDRQLRRYALLAAAIFLTAAVVSAVEEIQTRDRAAPPVPSWMTSRTVWPPAPGPGPPPAPGSLAPNAPGHGTVAVPDRGPPAAPRPVRPSGAPPPAASPAAPPSGAGVTRPGHPPAAHRVDGR
ncbi:RNA polymerase sigma factor [Streptomyces sp. 184]|uniref:RNA polymerase sigma factor n=1 Tax=Streptomyces sp. 184 TaxID=1827526 RepID=UPI003891DE4E